MSKTDLKHAHDERATELFTAIPFHDVRNSGVANREEAARDVRCRKWRSEGAAEDRVIGNGLRPRDHKGRSGSVGDAVGTLLREGLAIEKERNRDFTRALTGISSLFQQA